VQSDRPKAVWSQDDRLLRKVSNKESLRRTTYIGEKIAASIGVASCEFVFARQHNGTAMGPAGSAASTR
jgi:hypothetical protein